MRICVLTCTPPPTCLDRGIGTVGRPPAHSAARNASALVRGTLWSPAPWPWLTGLDEPQQELMAHSAGAFAGELALECSKSCSAGASLGSSRFRSRVTESPVYVAVVPGPNLNGIFSGYMGGCAGYVSSGRNSQPVTASSVAHIRLCGRLDSGESSSPRTEVNTMPRDNQDEKAEAAGSPLIGGRLAAADGGRA